MKAAVAMVRLWSLAVCCTLALPAVAQVRSVKEKDFIAFRYDAERVVIYTTESSQSPPPQPDLPRSVPEGSRPLAAPLAKYPGRHIVELEPPSTVSDRAGDRWTIDGAPGITVTATAERSVFGGGGCFGSYGVIARVDESSREPFRAVKFRYHVARRGAVVTRVAGSALAELPGHLDRNQRARVEAAVRPELARAVRAVTEEAAPSYARANARADSRRWASAWRTLDAALLRGEGTLAFDVQRFRLTPDGDPRLFVRADLRVGGKSAFLMSFWLRDQGDSLAVERSDAEAARHIRIREYGGPMVVPRSRLGEVFAIVDSDGNGWAEILVTAYGYEGQSVTAYEYTAAGLRPAGASFQWGC